MAGYTRFPRPLMTDRYAADRPRFNTPQQVHPQRNGQRNFPDDRRTDNRPNMNKPNNIQRTNSQNKLINEANKPVGSNSSATGGSNNSILPSQSSTTTQQVTNNKIQATARVSPTDVPTKIITPTKPNTTIVGTTKPDVVPPTPSSSSISESQPLDSSTTTNPTTDQPKIDTTTVKPESQPSAAVKQATSLQPISQQTPAAHHSAIHHQQHASLPQQQQRGPKRPRPPNEYQQASVYNQGGAGGMGNSSFEQEDRKVTPNSSQQGGDKKPTTGGRCRLFIGNVPSDLTQDEFQVLFGKYGELVEYFVNPSRGFGFIKLSSRSIAEQAKLDLDGYLLRGKPLRIRFASQGATVKVKNLSMSVSNELLKEAFAVFGSVERAVVIVDDRGKSTGEGIIEFEKKPSAQNCLNDCTEHCFFITSELKPVIVEPWDTKDEEDGLPEKSLIKNALYNKERELKPRFADINSIEHTIGLKWKELELQEKQLYEEVKKRMQYATEQVQIEIDQMLLEHQSQLLREGTVFVSIVPLTEKKKEDFNIRSKLLRRQEELRRIDELRTQDLDRRRNIQMRRQEHYVDSFGSGVTPQVAAAAAYAAQALQQQGNPQMNFGGDVHTYSNPLANLQQVQQQQGQQQQSIDSAYTTAITRQGNQNDRYAGQPPSQQEQSIDVNNRQEVNNVEKYQYSLVKGEREQLISATKIPWTAVIVAVILALAAIVLCLPFGVYAFYRIINAYDTTDLSVAKDMSWIGVIIGVMFWTAALFLINRRW
ncbi:unnamed protein product [Didymodactylos carnosus]|uniref:RRM domain-containing protein n=1 Tax=Didymodactylos carnosus TaxID=1234261 RepID=A0A8S2DHG8_9BILA|nr:unnamed protein product [Didymodactylos carnosus]CAF3676538.1 unnamed protein product [Didymodactylos carnosus]